MCIMTFLLPLPLSLSPSFSSFSLLSLLPLLLSRFLDPEMKAAIELQIKEFGQTPKQLFREPHPKCITVSGTKSSVSRNQSEPELSLKRELLKTTSSDSFNDDWVFIQSSEGMGVWNGSIGMGVWEWENGNGSVGMGVWEWEYGNGSIGMRVWE